MCVHIHIPGSSADVSDGNKIIPRDALMDDLIAKESHEEVVLLIETRVHNRRVSMVHSRTTRATWTLAGSPGIRLS